MAFSNVVKRHARSSHRLALAPLRLHSFLEGERRDRLAVVAGCAREVHTTAAELGLAAATRHCVTHTKSLPPATTALLRRQALPGRMPIVEKKLLVLDLDETLVHASDFRLGHEETFSAGPYYVYSRPHLDQFVEAVLQTFRVGVWTASGDRYASLVLERIFPAGALEFVWSSQRCTLARDWTTGEYTALKNLRKLKARGYPLESIIAVDDTPSKYAKHYGNLVTVREFLGDPGDDELPLLAAYLRELAEAPNVRTVEKRGWRQRAHELLAKV